MDRICPECGDKLTPISTAPNEAVEAFEMTSTAKVYACSACQLRFATDATGWLLELDP